MKKKAVVTVGISASGKSTWASLQDAKVIERDNIRRQILMDKSGLTYSENMWSKWKFNKENEQMVTKEYDNKLALYSDAGLDIICADTNLNPVYRKLLIQKLEALGYEVEVKLFPIDFLEAVKRDEKRRDTTGRLVLYTQYKQFLEFMSVKKYVPDITKPKAIMVDIDGTLAHMNGQRKPFDWDKVGVDDLDEHVANLVQLYSNAGYSIIIMTGRDGCSVRETLKWLDKHRVKGDIMFMRAAGDMRKDVVVKSELFWENVAPNYNVKFVIDDRLSVVRMWNEIGLKCFCVGHPDNEF